MAGANNEAVVVLKAGVIRTPHNEGVSFDRDSDHVAVTEDETEFYIKSEADEVIRHQKYKRCLAMAKWCDEVMMSCELRGYAVHRIWANRHQWAMRWKYRWLELAEQFKEDK